MKSLDELASHCIRCGFCLESCPTFVLTGEETESPRGRIYLARTADEGKLSWREIEPHLDQCLGCRACETACPSGVEYGEILEIARDRIEQEHHHLGKAMLLGSLTDAARLRRELALSNLLPGSGPRRRPPKLLSRLVTSEAPEADLPKRQADEWAALALPASKASGEVYMLEGCAMRALFPRVHTATRRLLARIGFMVRETRQGCCGALHAHNGFLDKARKKAARLVSRMPEDLPIIVNSAGCGSTMKAYDELLASAASEAEPTGMSAVPVEFAKRVFDISEFFLANGLRELLKDSDGIRAKIAYQDACHLRHGQRIIEQPRELLRAVPGLELVEIDEPEMCCGSAGIYNLTQPKMARQLLERKWSNIEKSGAEIVVTGNPGCHSWIGQASREHSGKVRVLHLAELLEASFIGLPS